MVYGEYVSIKENQSKISVGDLPKYDEFIYYFGVNFPKQTSYLMAGNKLWVFFSFLLLLTVLFFVYALSIILRQKRLSELQKDFINNMTHEFKTPISTIHIASEALLQDASISGDKSLKNYTQIIKEQNERLNRQVEKVLQIAEIERKEIELKYEEVHVHKQINSIAKSVELKLKNRKGDIEINLDAADDVLHCDKLHLTNILYNIIDNSLKYTQSKPSIKIETSEMERFLYLKISDNGMGIPQEHLQEVKNKFFRVPTGRVHNVKGFGLGLYYVDQICKAHHWQWDIESKLGEGTSILFKIKR
jgi:two-component system phosphate regulon sensor histidine kinase PhoR